MTAGELRFRTQSDDGLFLIDCQGEVVPHWTSEAELEGRRRGERAGRADRGGVERCADRGGAGGRVSALAGDERGGDDAGGAGEPRGHVQSGAAVTGGRSSTERLPAGAAHSPHVARQRQPHPRPPRIPSSISSVSRRCAAIAYAAINERARGRTVRNRLEIAAQEPAPRRRRERRPRVVEGDLRACGSSVSVTTTSLPGGEALIAWSSNAWKSTLSDAGATLSSR